VAAPRISLEQWRALQAVVEAGGYAQAAGALHKSQSTVTYAVQKIEQLLGVKVFEIRGRKAELTEAGQVLYRRARTLLEEAAALERGAAEMARDWQPEIRIAVEIIFPTWLLLECLAEFAQERPETRIEVYETVLTGTAEMLQEGRVDLAIGSSGAGTEGIDERCTKPRAPGGSDRELEPILVEHQRGSHHARHPGPGPHGLSDEIDLAEHAVQLQVEAGEKIPGPEPEARGQHARAAVAIDSDEVRRVAVERGAVERREERVHPRARVEPAETRKTLERVRHAREA
jgi:DNA-binding transcriptional LysR family regulator